MKNPNQLIEEAELKCYSKKEYKKYESNREKLAFKYGSVAMQLAIQLEDALKEIENLKTIIK